MKNSRRIGWFLRFLVKHWQKVVPLPDDGSIEPDVVIPTSFVTGREALTDGTREVLKWAIGLATFYDNPAVIAMSNCSYPFPGAEEVEQRLRQEMIDVATKHQGRPIFKKVIHADPMVSTVNEAMNVRRALNAQCIYPKNILVVTGQGHSRGAHKIWSTVFPNARVYLSLINFSYETQPDHPVHDQRSPWKWFVMNVLRQCALWVFPLRALAKVQHGNGNLLFQILRNLKAS